MADATQFYREMIATVRQFITNLDQLKTISDRIANDSSLATSAADAAAAGGRPDLTAADIDNAKSAIDQIVFTFNSGEPPQKQYLYEML